MRFRTFAEPNKPRGRALTRLPSPGIFFIISPGIFGETPLVSLIDFVAAPSVRSGRPVPCPAFPCPAPGSAAVSLALLVACRCGAAPCRFRGCLDCAASAAARPRRGRFRLSYFHSTSPPAGMLLDNEFTCSVEPMRPETGSCQCVLSNWQRQQPVLRWYPVLHLQ